MNGTSASAPTADDVGLHELVWRQARRTPERVAIEARDGSLTYAQLTARADALAQRLSDGLDPAGAVVALPSAASIDAVVAILAILRAGAAYVPLDPGMPAQRAAFIERDANVVAKLAVTADGIEVVRGAGAGYAAADDPWREPILARGDIAYVIYTSGSTGRPKGVAVPHGAVVNLIRFMERELRTQEVDRVLQIAPLAFDASVEEIFATLARGATLVLCDAEMLSSTRTLLRAVAELRVSVFNIPTALFHLLALDLAAGRTGTIADSVRLIVTGGEALRPDHVSTVLQHVPGTVRLLDMYGPTETAVTAMVSDVRRDWRWQEAQVTALGRPVANLQVSVRDDALQPVAPGSAGELCVSGAGLAAGYLGLPDETARRFVPDPKRPTARMYRTGDLARLGADGRISFAGRRDHQVKVRGHRVELGEVELAIARQPGVAEVVVVVREDEAGSRRLVAFVVADADAAQTLATAELRAALAGSLPAYALPAQFVALAELPRTPSGKVDRVALAERDGGPAPAVETTAVRWHDEQLRSELKRIFCEVLAFDEIPVDADFFELGGHSLSAMRVVTLIEQRFGTELPRDALRDAPSVAELTELIGARLAVEAT